MLKRFPIHPLLFALSPLLLLLAHNADPLQLGVVLRTGALWLGGGVGLYALFWALTRHPLRAALLASLCLLFLFAYDPAYELVRGRSLLGVTLGKHRFLAPVWAGVLAACAYGTWRRLAHPQRLTPVYTAAGLIMLGFSLAGVTFAGAWQPALRAAGLLPPPGLEVTFIDVGNVVPGEPGVVGEAIWLQTADGENALIDGGFPNPVVAAYLQDHGVTRLDLVVLTHAHDDHSGGLIDVLGSIPVDVLVHSGQTLDSPVYLELQAAIAAAGIETRVVRSGDRLPFGDLVFDVLSPALVNPESINNNSVVLRLTAGRVVFLFTGDSDQLEERRLLEAGLAEPVDVLKVGHHGGDTSSNPAYIAAISPDVAVYSVGAGNEYQFPHAVVLDALRGAGAQIYGTDRNGTIVVRTDGTTYEVLTERGGPRE